MKQVLLGNRIYVTDVPAPGISPGCVLVETAYSFISSGTEAAPVKRTQAGLVEKAALRAKQLPRVLESVRVNGVKKTMLRVNERLDARSGRLGYSSSGRVLAVGRDVHDMSPGDRVVCAGMGQAVHAEVVSVPRNLVAKVPSGCELRDVCGTTIAAIALQGVRRAGLQLGETAAVLGLGLIGRMTLQLLQASGVDVIGFDPDRNRVEAAIRASHLHCHALSGEEATKQVHLSAPHGADATIITAATAHPGICQAAIEMTRKKGRVVVVGAVPLEFSRDPFYRKEIDFLISCSYGPGRYDATYEEAGQDYPFAYVRWTENRNMQAALKLIASGHLDLSGLIDKEYPIDKANQAFAALTTSEGDRPLGIVLKYPIDDETQRAQHETSVRLAPPVKPDLDKVSLGVVGVGQFFGKTHLPNLTELTDQYHISAVCSRNGSVAQDLARRTKAAFATTDPMVVFDSDEVDAVLITTRHDTHASLAAAALQHGKHVFVEKPLAMNREELENLRRAQSDSGKYLMVGFNRRFSTHVERVQHLLQRRQTPLHIVYRVLADHAVPDSWIYGPSGGGRVIGEACHMLDLLNCLVGPQYDVEELDVTSSPPTDRLPAGDNFSASLRYTDGSICTLCYSVLGRKSEQNEKERLEISWDGETFVVDNFHHSYGTPDELKPLKVFDKGHHNELQRFATYLKGRDIEPISMQSLIRATELSLLIDQACRHLSPPGKVDACRSQSI